MNNDQALKAQIAAKVAAYQAANKKAQKANFGLPTANVGCCFATKKQETALNEQYTFDNMPAHW